MIESTVVRVITDAMRIAGALHDGEVPSQSQIDTLFPLLKLYEANAVMWMARQIAPIYGVSDSRLPPCVLQNEGAGFYGESVKLPIEEQS